MAAGALAACWDPRAASSKSVLPTSRASCAPPASAPPTRLQVTCSKTRAVSAQGQPCSAHSLLLAPHDLLLCVLCAAELSDTAKAHCWLCADVVETAAWTGGSRHLQANQAEQPWWAVHNFDLLAIGCSLLLSACLALVWLARTGLRWL